MNEFDQFMKHQAKAKYYIRYADDFVIFSDNKEQLKTVLLQISAFLEFCLGLKLHPGKVFIKTVASGGGLSWMDTLSRPSSIAHGYQKQSFPKYP